MTFDYDVIVVGAGHAGFEAARICAIRNMKTAIFCMSLSHVGNLPCNPSIGGSAKGILVKEIDALGGMMGKLADRNSLQIKMLNLSKGPGVHALRAQVDKLTYPQDVLNTLKSTPNLTIIESEVKELLFADGRVLGVRLEDNKEIRSKAVILTNGTYLEADILRGSRREEGGPDGDRRSTGLSASLKQLGLKLFRLKTGTPPRLDRSTIDYSGLEIQEGSSESLHFGYDTENKNPNLPCYLTYTNATTHDIILANLPSSAMYGGYVKGTGPRYCPSIEDKIVRFKDKPRHQLFLEPESLSNDSIYLQGFSTSMPIDVQEQMVHSLKGLEKARILKYAYAIEYDAIEPLQFDHSLKIRGIEGLYGAGQIIGTSGYEEAAALGLMAGINATNRILGLEDFVLEREEAYIGVMIDDLVSKGTKEPYRVLSSRSEYRLLTRSDNAIRRLSKYAIKYKTIQDERIERIKNDEVEFEKALSMLSKIHVGNNKELQRLIVDRGVEFTDPKSKSLSELIASRVTTYKELSELSLGLTPLSTDMMLSIDIEILYEGYIRLARKEALRIKRANDIPLPADLDYMSIGGISMEAREKLIKIKPKTIGAASRITNVHPSDINVLLLYLKSIKAS